MTHIGIDPGGSGGIAILHADGKVEAHTIPEYSCDLLYLMKRKLEECDKPILVIMEKVQGYIGSFGNAGGGLGNTGASMFEFGKVYGRLEMMLDALRELGFPIKSTVITPSVWQKAMKVPPRIKRGPKKESKGQHKAKLAGIARTHFSQKIVTLETADALLLAKYSKEVHQWSKI